MLLTDIFPIIKIISLMICSKCVHNRQSEVRIRCTPTFYHHPIFDDFGATQFKKSRCSATYHSNVFNHNHNFRQKNILKQQEQFQGNLQKECCCSQKEESKINQNQQESNIKQKKVRPSTANKQIKLQKQISFNPQLTKKSDRAGSPTKLLAHTLLWFDPKKQVLLRQCSSCYYHDIAKERKMLELSSDPLSHHFVSEQFNSKRSQEQKNQCCQGKACNCSSSCSCGNGCKCCPKFSSLPSCCQGKACNCSSSCSCGNGCKCCPKFQAYQNQKANLFNNSQKNENYGCPSKCKCGDKCNCGPSCKCEKLTNKQLEKTVKLQEKGKKVTIMNGSRKSKIQESNIRKSQPVFKSITGPRR